MADEGAALMRRVDNPFVERLLRWGAFRARR